jgi:ASCH domain
MISIARMMRVYEKALIIDEPWVSKILEGEKVWELRSTRTNFNGPLVLIRKTSGTVIGIATLVGCLLLPQSRADLALHEPLHKIPPAEQDRAAGIGRGYPLSLAQCQTFASAGALRPSMGTADLGEA